MVIRTELMLPVIDASQEDWEEKSHWEEQAREALLSRSNFIVVFNPNGSGLRQLMGLLDCPPSVLPESLSRWGIHGLIDALRDEDYRWLLSVCADRDARIIEQLHLCSNHPPQSKPYLVYSEIHGIISDYEELPEAHSSYAEYLAQFERARLFPLSGIYQWQGGQWHQIPTAR